MKSPRMFSILMTFGLLLGIHNGYIALWYGDDPEPARVFPYKASLLPEQDRRLLEAGIPIESESRLHSLLEDYLS